MKVNHLCEVTYTQTKKPDDAFNYKQVHCERNLKIYYLTKKNQSKTKQNLKSTK